jgi:hypothetical protein
MKRFEWNFEVLKLTKNDIDAEERKFTYQGFDEWTNNA